MPFQFNQRKPIKEWKLLDTFQWKVLQAVANIDGKDRGTPEGTWVPDGGIVTPCVYYLYGAKIHKSSVWEKSKQSEKNLTFKKARI